MTDGEKMVWAAAFVASGKEMLGDGDEYWPGAIETAWAYVMSMRESVDEVREGWGEDSENFAMLREMLD